MDREILLTRPAPVCICTQQHLLQVSAVRSSVRSRCRRRRQRHCHSHWLRVLTWVWPDGSLVWPDKMAVPPPRITRACWSRTLCILLMTSASRIFPICLSRDRDWETVVSWLQPSLRTSGQDGGLLTLKWAYLSQFQSTCSRVGCCAWPQSGQHMFPASSTISWVPPHLVLAAVCIPPVTTAFSWGLLSCL